MSLWRRTRQFSPILIVGIVGVLVSVAGWYLTLSAENRVSAREFVDRANNQASILQNGIDDYWGKLYGVRSLFDASSQDISREQFENFCNSLLVGHAAILNMAWIPRVRRDERAAHEAAAARDGLTDYHIRRLAPDGTLSIAPEQDEYFPKFYSTQERTAPVYGIDLHDDKTGPWLDHMRDAGTLSTTAPLALLIGQGDRLGFLAGVPVYARGLPHESLEDRRRNLLGFVQGVFQIGVLVDDIFAGVQAPVRLYLFAPNASADDPPVFFRSRLNQGWIEPRTQAQLAGEQHRSFTIKLGDVRWAMVVAPEPTALVSAGHARSRLVLIFGLLFSGGVTTFVWAIRRSARQVEVANMHLDTALNNMAQGLIMFDSAGRLTTSNRRVADLFGMPWERWRTGAAGLTVPQALDFAYGLTNIGLKNRVQAISDLQGILASRRTGTIILERLDGRTFSASCSTMADGGFVVTFEDITERRRTEDQISHMARYDGLTDLPNRVLFYEKMDALLAHAAQRNAFAVFSIDLDHFKSVNDTLGHPIGDKLLQAVAARMRACIREDDIIARLGGDEFAVVQISIDQPADVTSLATRLINATSAPYQIDGHEVIVGTSIGIAIAPDDGAEPDQLMKNADLALYRSKADGGGVYRFFEVHMDARMRQRRALELDLRKALPNGEFSLNYQPILSVKTGKVSACEALIRWHQPERGVVPPTEFVPIAEETGLIISIGEWVLRQACVDAVQWPDDIAVAVNVSPVQFKSTNLVGVVKNALENSHLRADRLELEITELVMVQDKDAALILLRQLKTLGVSIAMDDFGTGYSSLGYLRSFPFDRIKIDQSFIRDLPTSGESLAILRAVVGLGRSLNIVTTAEGVEKQEQLEVLRAEGCNDAQGYFFSQPKSAAEMKELLTTLNGKANAVA